MHAGMPLCQNASEGLENNRVSLSHFHWPLEYSDMASRTRKAEKFYLFSEFTDFLRRLVKKNILGVGNVA
jgi:hypothetical protein